MTDKVWGGNGIVGLIFRAGVSSGDPSIICNLLLSHEYCLVQLLVRIGMYIDLKPIMETISYMFPIRYVRK